MNILMWWLIGLYSIGSVYIAFKINNSTYPRKEVRSLGQDCLALIELIITLTLIVYFYFNNGGV